MEQDSYNIYSRKRFDKIWVKMQYFPLNLKLSYNQRLDIQMFIRHQFQSQKFKRHWIVCKGYESEQENKILKTYLSFINQGDLYKVKTSNHSGKWKEKTFEDICTILEKESTIQRKMYKLDLVKEFLAVQQETSQKQYNQLLVMTIFWSGSQSERKLYEFTQFLESFESSQVVLNLFLPDQYIDKILPTRTWLRIYSQKDLKPQVRGLFSVLSKTMYKKITIELKCLDADIIINDSTEQLAKNCWKSQNNEYLDNSFIENNIFFPSANSPYIMSVEIKSLMKHDACRFEIVMNCEDETGKVGRVIKSFSLKPTKEFLDWTEHRGASQNESQSMYRYQQLSLNFEEVNLNQKLNFIKIIGTPVRVLLKNRSEV